MQQIKIQPIHYNIPSTSSPDLSKKSKRKVERGVRVVLTKYSSSLLRFFPSRIVKVLPGVVQLLYLLP